METLTRLGMILVLVAAGFFVAWLAIQKPKPSAQFFWRAFKLAAALGILSLAIGQIGQRLAAAEAESKAAEEQALRVAAETPMTDYQTCPRGTAGKIIWNGLEPFELEKCFKFKAGDKISLDWDGNSFIRSQVNGERWEPWGQFDVLFGNVDFFWYASPAHGILIAQNCRIERQEGMRPVAKGVLAPWQHGKPNIQFLAQSERICFFFNSFRRSGIMGSYEVGPEKTSGFFLFFVSISGP